MKTKLITLTGFLILGIFFITLDSIFVFLSPPKVISLSPENGSQDVLLNSSLIIKFNKPIRRREIQISILPETHGEWRFEDPLFKNHFFKTLIFSPAIDFHPGTQYQVEIKNIKGFGLEKSNSFSFAFKTLSLPETSLKENEKDENKTLPEKPDSEEITILNIPLDWQDYSLSCEAASLKMALAGKGIYVSEEEIMEKIGYDLTPRQDHIWGDPHQNYVGDINGKICSTGYGVYWEPLAKAANYWRPAQAFSNFKLKDLLKEVKEGNPVIVWGVLPKETLTDCSWFTKEGKYIKAFKETHVRLVIGFVGSLENPSKIILNDPLAGRLYWESSYFLKNWAIFNYSGVIIR